MITLDAATGGVASPQMIDVATSEPGVTLYIFTGISMPQMYNIDDTVLFWTSSHERSERVEVTLGRLPSRMIASAAQVSLARIWSYPILFNLHLTEVWVEQAPSGDIILKYNADMTGTAGLVGVSYQVNLKAINIETEIRGLIRWTSRFRPRLPFDSLFDLAVRGAAGLTAAIDGPPVTAPNFTQLPFVIHNPPLGTPLVVTVTPRSGSFLIDGVPSEAIGARQVAGPNPVMVTVAEPRRNDLIFEVYEIS